jgi:hypothetical protein
METKPIELADRALVTSRLRRFPPQTSEQTFTNLYVWRYHRPVRLAEVGGALLFLELRGEEWWVLGPPAGDVDPARLVKPLREAGITAFRKITADVADALRAAGLQVAADPDNSDYVYARRDLAELAGRKYHRKKNLVNRCLSAYECEYCEVTPDVLDEIEDMNDRWAASRDLEPSQGLAEEYWALREAFDHFEDFELIGGAVRVAGRIEAFSLGEALNETTAVVHFEKAMGEFQGLYQVMNQWFCRHGLAPFEFVNREQDMGIPGLRQAKESYHPHHMVDKFVARWMPGQG